MFNLKGDTNIDWPLPRLGQLQNVFPRDVLELKRRTLSVAVMNSHLREPVRGNAVSQAEGVIRLRIHSWTRRRDTGAPVDLAFTLVDSGQQQVVARVHRPSRLSRCRERKRYCEPRESVPPPRVCAPPARSP